MLHRRSFIAGAGAAGVASLAGLRGASILSNTFGGGLSEIYGPTPTWSLTPVVGDGHWIWTKPPTEKGFLEPREYDLNIAIEMTGNGNANQVRATTAVPVVHPEQSIEVADVVTDGCAAQLRQISTEAGQLILGADRIERGQTLRAEVQMKVTLSKQYQGYERDMFPEEQSYPREFTRLFLHDSPGIQTRIAEVREVATEVASGITHPWDKAVAFHEWVWDSIEGRRGNYTSVVEAVRDKVGDCEERAATFVAFCRVHDIPARLVWVPNHNWAEFYLTDENGQGHWIPAHTSCYSWFGWTGAHELVLQKGDNLDLPEKRGNTRLLDDWAQWSGSRPEVSWQAELKPLPASPGADAGPGARTKVATGEWQLTGEHAIDGYGRDGAYVGTQPAEEATAG